MSTSSKILIAIALVAVGVIGRLVPHAWNFAPIIAIGLLAGARLGKGYGFAVPVAAMIASDVFIGFYDWSMNATVYVAMALSGGIGLFLRRTKNPAWIASAAVFASFIFYFLTNAAVWKFGTMYDPGLAGLSASLIAGLPFLKNAIVGDIWYSFALFGAFELAHALYRRKTASLQHAPSYIKSR